MRYVGATIFKRGRVCDIVGLEVEPGRGAVAIGECQLPSGVGADGGKLARVARKLARSKALKRISRAALQAAGKASGAQRASALKLASVAARSASKLQRSAMADAEELQDDDDLDAEELQDDDDLDAEELQDDDDLDVGLSADWGGGDL